MAKKEEIKAVLERTYIIPLRKECKKVPEHRKAKKAMKCIREFIARHMQVREEAEKKIILSRFLNEAIWFRGIKNPPYKIKVKATKYSDGKVEVELAELPKRAEIAKAREQEEKAKAEAKRKAEEEKAKKEEAEKSKAEKTSEEIEKEKRAEELKKEERLLEKEHKEVLKETREVERELIKPKMQVQQRKALEK